MGLKKYPTMIFTFLFIVIQAEKNGIPVDPLDYDYIFFPEDINLNKKFIKKREIDKLTNLTDSNFTNFENETMMNCTNDYCTSDEEYFDMLEGYIYPQSYEWALIACHSVVFIIGLIGNALVCVAVYRNHSMRTVTNYFIVNLAVADFMVILFCLPPTVLWDVTETWFFGPTMCKIVLYLQTVSVTVSVLTLTFISIDRWYAICYPLRFNSTTGRAKTAILVIWLVALVFDIPELIVFTTKRKLMKHPDIIYFTQCEPSWSADSDSTWNMLKMILLYLFPLCFMSIAYCQIVRVLWHSGNLHGHIEFNTGSLGSSRRVNTFTMNSNASTEGQLRSRRKAAKMLVAVVVMFGVCYFPVHLFNVIRLTIDIPPNDMFKILALILHLMCYANSAVNPVIYNFMSGKFRREFRDTFGCNCFTDHRPGVQRQRTNMTRSSTYIYRFTTGGSTQGARTEVLPLSQLRSTNHTNNYHTNGNQVGSVMVTTPN